MNVALAGFFPIHEKDKRLGFLKYKPRLHFQFFPKSLKSLDIGIDEVPLISYFVSRQSMFVEERGTHFLIKVAVFMKEKCSYLNKNFLSD